MITKYTLLKEFEKPEYIKEGFTYDKKTGMVLDKGEEICHIDQLLERVRKNEHCNFEVIYSDCLDNVTYRCKDCGTVIFGGDDERYDPLLRCPGCGGYHCHTDWWSGEDIANDPEKQKEIEVILKAQEENEKYDKWYAETRKKQEEKGKKKGWPYHWLEVEDLWKYRKDFKKPIFNKSGFVIRLKADSRYWEGYKKLVIEWYTLREEDGHHYCNKCHHIPLTPKSIWFYWIFPLTPKYRKYLKERKKEWRKNGTW